MKVCVRCLLGLAVVVLLGVESPGQTLNRWIGASAATGADWTNNVNWSEGFVPDPAFDAAAVIGSDTGNPAVAAAIEISLTTDLSASPSSTVTLGDGGGFQGTLSIATGGRLDVAADASAEQFGGGAGDLNVGVNGGVGVLNVSGSGVLNLEGQLTQAPSSDGASAITLSDSATVSAGSAAIRRNLQIIGSGVSFATTGNAALDAAGTHTWEFGAGGPSALSVGGELDLGGTLRIVKTDGAPAVGDAFVIGDSSSVTGGFAQVDTSGIEGLGLGVSFRAVSTADGGSTNGVLTSVVVEQQPVLYVNRQSGEVRLENPGAAASVSFDTYVVGSGGGSLDPSSWNSIAPADGWQQGNPSPTTLSELNPLSTESLAGQEAVSLGTAFQPSESPLGDNTEDVSFRFAPIGQGFVNGVVVYEGVPTDNLTLNVDRTTGQVQIINGFREAIEIDTYVVSSASGALNPSPAGWQGLGGDWQIGPNSSELVSELNPVTSLELGNGDAASLGELYDFDAVSGEEDLVFRYTLPTENFFRTGKVVFADELSVLLSGDYNLDGVVDAADYTVWRDGDSPYDSQAGYDLWAANYGATLPQSAAAIPEPSTLVGLAPLLALVARRR